MVCRDFILTETANRVSLYLFLNLRNLVYLIVTAAISDKATRQATIEDFLKELQALDGLITEFDPMLWVSLVDFVTVYSKDDVRVTFKDGTEIQA